MALWREQWKIIQLWIEELPWVVLKISDYYFALNARFVTAISSLDQECIPIPQSRPHFRGQPMNLLDLRILIGNVPLSKLTVNFNEMINTIKEDHLRWIRVLEESVSMGKKFTLATDPHQCAFGKWYDNFHTDNQKLSFHLRKIAESHRLLHHSAVKIENAIQNNDEETAAKLLVQAKSVYVKRLWLYWMNWLKRFKAYRSK